MTELDDLVADLGQDAGYDVEAAGRLELKLATEPRPRALGRRRTLAATLAFAAAATIGGASMGAAIEINQAPAATAPLLPATPSGTAAALLFGDR